MIQREDHASAPVPGSVRPIIFATLGVCVLAGIVAGFLLLRSDPGRPAYSLSLRPDPQKPLFDNAGLLRLQDEGVENYLKGIRDKQKIDAVILTLPDLRGFGDIREAAAKIMTDWKIGGDFGNRGLLLLLAAAEKEVKMEVTYELEDVFTDLYTGAVEERQLKPHLRAGDIGSALTAVMEEMENRAEIKFRGGYTPQSIADRDAKYASGGAGAGKNIADLARAGSDPAPSGPEAGSSIFTDSALLALGKTKDPRFPAGATPEEAYRLMREAFSQESGSREALHFLKIRNARYEILQTETRAVIYFGNKEGWESAPYLFAKLPDGWKFDMVNQGFIVRMGPAPQWGVERGDHDYMDLLEKCPFWQTIDIPWEEADIYRVEEDTRIVADILRLEEEFRRTPDDFRTALELGRLGALTGRRLNQVIPYLEKARTLKPEDPAPFKYMAAAYVTTSYQYQKAMAALEELLRLDPQNLFGRKYLGFLSFVRGDLSAAEKHLRIALKIAPADCYAAAALGRVYAKIAREGGSAGDKAVAEDLYRRAESSCGPGHRRVAWLRNELLPALGSKIQKDRP